MSYDIAVFFNSNESDINVLSRKLEEILGFSFNTENGNRGPEAFVLGLEVDLIPRNSFLEDTEDMKFTEYTHQLDFSSRRSSYESIHPVG